MRLLYLMIAALILSGCAASRTQFVPRTVPPLDSRLAEPCQPIPEPPAGLRCVARLGSGSRFGALWRMCESSLGDDEGVASVSFEYVDRLKLAGLALARLEQGLLPYVRPRENSSLHQIGASAVQLLIVRSWQVPRLLNLEFQIAS